MYTWTEETRCNLCGTTGLRPLHRVEWAPDEPPFTVARCLDCGFTFVNPRPSDEDVLAFFRRDGLLTDTVDPEGRRRSLLSEREQKTPEFRRALRLMERVVPGGRMLDVGCGPGFFLALLGPAWQGEGVDVSPAACAHALEALGRRVQEGTFLDAKYPDAAFDAVTMHQFLDHVVDPHAHLAEAARVLRPGGLLMLTNVINIASPCARIFGPYYRLLHPLHLSYFSPRTLRRMLMETGFEPLAIGFPYWGTRYCTPRELGRLAWRAARLRLLRPLAGGGDPILSPPFWGNMMTALARRRAGAEGHRHGGRS